MCYGYIYPFRNAKITAFTIPNNVSYCLPSNSGKTCEDNKKYS